MQLLMCPKCFNFLFLCNFFQTGVLPNHTHMKKEEHISGFIFGIYWSTWKTTKKLLKWTHQKRKNFNICNVVFFLKKKKKNTWRYRILQLCKKNFDMIYSSWYMEYDWLELIILSHSLSFYLHQNPKNQNFERMKIMIFHYHFTNAYQKSQSYDVFLWWSATDMFFFCHFRPFFALLSPPPKKKQPKKDTQVYYFTLVYHRWQSHDV